MPNFKPSAASAPHEPEASAAATSEHSASPQRGARRNLARPRLARRALLRGLGSIALGLPWLEAMRPLGDAHAQSSSTARRFVAVYQPGGTVLDRWRPTGSEDDFTLSPILEPLSAVQHKLLVLDGLDMKSAVGEQHQAGIVALLTGTPQSGQHQQFASGPSIDQVLAKRLSEGKARASIELAVRWATGKSHGLLHPINSMIFADDDRFSPISPRLDPVQIWTSLFGSLEGDGDTAATRALLSRRQSILDYVDRRHESLIARLGGADRAKLEAHLTKVREMEQSLATLAELPRGTCTAPTHVDTSDYEPRSGLNSADDGSLRDVSSDAAIPKVGRFMIDMLVTALACDLTGVASLQWSDTEAKHTFPWLNLSEHHHYYQHDGGFRPDECELIARWYAEQHAYLLEAMDAVDMGGHTLLDESVVFFGSELQDPPTHIKSDMPFLLAGGGGGLRSGRYLRFDHQPHNDLLVSILNLFGDPREHFGSSQYSQGPLAGLT